ncbi:MAG: phytochelatin synthase family protein [Desulfobacterium sp.]|jgi:hypothetical protein|nr:phytochelatin synthase family protein [Desulfobacterium sp.]
MTLSKMMMRTYLYLRYFFHKTTGTGSFGSDRADYILTPYEESENLLKNALFRHHVKQFHESSCSVASVVNGINAILDRRGVKDFVPITQQQILERVRAGHWKERMGEDGHNGRRGLPLMVLAQVVEKSLEVYGINSRLIEAVEAQPRGRRSRFIRKTLESRLKQFEKRGDCLIIAHFDQGSFVRELNIPHISPVGGFDVETGKVTILDVDPSQPHPYQISFDTFYRGISTDYNHAFRPLGFRRGGYIFIDLSAA